MKWAFGLASSVPGRLQGGRFRDETIRKSGVLDMKKTALAIAAFAALSGSAIAAALRVDIINVLAHFGSDPRINPRVGGLRATKLPQWRRNSAPVEQPL